MNTAPKNFLYGNSTGCDLRPFHTEIAASLKKNGTMPDDLADVFEANLVPAEHGNADGTPRYMIRAR
jgi:hypothetical protein